MRGGEKICWERERERRWYLLYSWYATQLSQTSGTHTANLGNRYSSERDIKSISINYLKKKIKFWIKNYFFYFNYSFLQNTIHSTIYFTDRVYLQPSLEEFSFNPLRSNQIDYAYIYFKKSHDSLKISCD